MKYNLQNTAKNKSVSAFTLLELLFVILIMGIISTALFSLYQKYAENAKIKRTAQQMQLILQAASSYYIDTNCWPNQPCPANVDFNKYLTFSKINPWGNPYTFNMNGKKFAVNSGAIPNPSLVAGNNPIAVRVANSLPIAAVNPTDPNQVTAEILVPPKVILSPGNVVIAGVGVSLGLGNGASLQTNAFSCPDPTWTGKADFLPLNIALNNETGAGTWQCRIEGSKTFDYLQANPTASNPCVYNAGTQSWSRSYSALFRGMQVQGLTCGADPVVDTNVGTVDWLWIAWCEHA